jgi:hypothetical protein
MQLTVVSYKCLGQKQKQIIMRNHVMSEHLGVKVLWQIDEGQMPKKCLLLLLRFLETLLGSVEKSKDGSLTIYGVEDKDPETLKQQ